MLGSSEAREAGKLFLLASPLSSYGTRGGEYGDGEWKNQRGLLVLDFRLL